MFYQIQQYFKFLKQSTNQHGVHSPFVYHLVTQCFYNKTKPKAYNAIKNYKAELLNNQNSVTITDLGSGSVYTTNKSRKISSLAQHAGASTKHAKLLFRLTQYFQFKNSLELGTSLGISSHAIGLGNPNGHLTTIEGCPEVSKFTAQNLQSKRLKNVSVLTGDFADVLPKLTNTSFDMVLFDGNHNKAATLKYFNLLLPKTHNDTVFIFDDIYWSKGMTEAWQAIKNHPKVTVTIDTFQYGFVFFRQEQAKEHFTIRL